MSLQNAPSAAMAAASSAWPPPPTRMSNQEISPLKVQDQHGSSLQPTSGYGPYSAHQKVYTEDDMNALQFELRAKAKAALSQQDQGFRQAADAYKQQAKDVTQSEVASTQAKILAEARTHVTAHVETVAQEANDYVHQATTTLQEEARNAVQQQANVIHQHAHGHVEQTKRAWQQEAQQEVQRQVRQEVSQAAWEKDQQIQNLQAQLQQVQMEAQAMQKTGIAFKRN